VADVDLNEVLVEPLTYLFHPWRIERV